MRSTDLARKPRLSRLAAFSRSGPRLRSGAAVALGAVVLCFLVLVLLALPRRQEQAYSWVAHTLEVLGAANKLEADLEVAVSDGRAYVIDRSIDSKRRFEGNASEVEADLAVLERLTADNAAQRGAIERLRPAIAGRLAVTREVTRWLDAGNEVGAMRVARTQQGRVLMDRAVATIAEMAATERRLLDQRGRVANDATRLTLAGLLACGVALAASGGFTARLLASRLRRKGQHLAELERLNAELEGVVAQRTAGLAESEARFRTTFEQAAVGIAHVGLDGHWLRVNARLAAMLGYTEAELVRHTFQEITHLDDLESDLAHLQALLSGEVTSYSMEKRYLRKDGDSLWATLTVALLRDPVTKAPQHFISVIEDITPRKRAEAGLRLSETRLRSYFEHVPDGLIVMHRTEDRRFVYDDLNPAAEVIYGLPREAVLGRSPREVWPGPADDEVERHLHACASGLDVCRYTVLRELRGGMRTLDVVLAPLMGEMGQPGFVLACVRDVTESRAVEVALRESETRLRDLLAMLDLGTFMARDLDGAIRFWSEGCARLYGWAAAEAIGQDAQGLLRTVFPVPQAEIEAVLEREGEWTGELHHRARDGREVIVAASKVLRRDAEGRPAAVLEALTDVTEAHRAEVRLRESQEALREAQKLEAIGRLAAGVAHDFNNILQGVSGGLELVLDEVEAGAPAREFAELALGSARRGSELTHHLLAYARKQILQPKRVEVAPFLAEMQRLLARTLGPHIAVEVQPGMSVPPIEVDPGQLHTALLNLAVNAAHAMPGGGALSLNAREIIGAGRRWIVIAATDTGAGMDEVTLAQACEPFFTTKGLDGTGLGLAMVQGFAEQSGGHVRIASAPGQGTTVMLWLPAAAAQPSSDPDEQRVATAPALRGSGWILLVDDAADVLAAAGVFLERAGFEVVRASGSEQALAALVSGERRFEALVTDYAMPGLNGVDLVERARAVRPGLPALLITGFAEAGGGVGTRPLPEGVAVLRKPFQRRQLVEAVLGAMGQDAAGQRAALGTDGGGAAQQQR